MTVKREVIFNIECWPIRQPLQITGYTFTEARVLLVTLIENGVAGRGEGSGVYYLGETAETLLSQAEQLRPALEAGLDRHQLQTLLPAGGARNAIDCALWDLEAKRSGQSIWQLTGISPHSVITVNTVGINSPEQMAETAKKLDTPKIKLKLDDKDPLACIAAVRQARPQAEIVVDVNQGWTIDRLKAWVPELQQLGVSMIEQPLPRGEDKALASFHSPIPLCADESCLDSSELEQAAGRYQMINIKLDKTGGLTEALILASKAEEKGMKLMVGNMLGTSLAMAPCYVIAQCCQLADLDGPVLLAKDRPDSMSFSKGEVSEPERRLWG
ncbi:N-acetyl-D-Glu racemase DgcA [SAR92 clade bacterium H246]